MINAIKYKMYVLFHNLSTYVILLGNILMSLITMAETANEDEYENTFNLFGGLFSAEFGGVILVLLIILTAIFMTSQYRHGYVKSLAANMSRNVLFISDAVMYVIMFVILSLEAMIACILFAPLYNYEVNFGNPTVFLRNLAQAFVIYCGIEMLVILLCHLCRKITAPLVAGLVYAFGVPASFLFIIDNAAGTDICRYDLSYLLYFGLEENGIINIFVALVYVVVFLALSYFVVRKKDI